MRKCFLAISMVALAVTGALLAPPVDVAAQTGPEYETYDDKAPKAAKAKQATFKRLPDGTPDIRGTWVRTGGGLNEAKPPDTALKPFGVLAEPQGFGQGSVAAGPGGGVAVRRAPKYAPKPEPARGIVEPEDRVLPYTPAGLAARMDYAKNICCPAKSIEYTELSMRCTPGAPWAGGSAEILQRPGKVVLMFESNHNSRVIYTDGRPHMNSNARFFGGDSTGKWEGNTLTVETTNLDGRGHWGVGSTITPFTHALKITERFMVVSDKLITYEITYDDPGTFTKPVKSVGYFYPQDEEEELVEVSCHEGSYALTNTFGF